MRMQARAGRAHPRGAQYNPAVTPLATALEEARHAHSTYKHSRRQLAKDSGYPPASIQDWCTGRRVPDNEEVLNDLGQVLGLTAEQIEHLQQLRRQALDTRSSPAISQAPQPAQQSGARRSRVALAIGAGLALLGVGFAAGSIIHAPDTRMPYATQARISNTEGVGVNTYGSPLDRTTTLTALPEGTEVWVVCLRPDGRPITDRYQGSVRTWAMWALLINGTWVPDLYLDTPKAWDAPNEAPSGTRRC